jgi:nitrous oxide reductase accessory protein NosL
MAVLLSVLARDRTRASGLAIATWFFFVLVFDLLLLGVLVATGGSFGGEAIAYLLLLNPADVFRILNVFSLDDVRTLYGLASIVPPALGSPAHGRRDGGLDCGATRPGELEIQTMNILFLPPRLRHPAPHAGLGWPSPPSAPSRALGWPDRLQPGGNSSADLKPGGNRPLHQLRARRHAAGRLPRPQGAGAFAGQDKPSLLSATRWNCSTPCWPANRCAPPKAVYVQDMGKADWNAAPRATGSTPRPPFTCWAASATAPWGPTIGSFAQEADAKKFAAEYGGKVLRFAEITADMVDLSGGALHDTRM